MTDQQKVYDLMKRFCQLEKGNPERVNIMLDVKRIIDFPTVEKSGFHEFWTAYPHKVAKGSAEKAWPKARKEAPLEVILSGVEWYKRNKPDQLSWAHPASWLNAKRWLDGQYKPKQDITVNLPAWLVPVAAEIGAVPASHWFAGAMKEDSRLVVPDAVKRDWIKQRYLQPLKMIGISEVV